MPDRGVKLPVAPPSELVGCGCGILVVVSMAVWCICKRGCYVFGFSKSHGTSNGMCWDGGQDRVRCWWER